MCSEILLGQTGCLFPKVQSRECLRESGAKSIAGPGLSGEVGSEKIGKKY